MITCKEQINQMEEAQEGGAEVALANMSECSYENIGRETFFFVRRVMRDPALREKIKKRAAEIREEEAQASACIGT